MEEMGKLNYKEGNWQPFIVWFSLAFTELDGQRENKNAVWSCSGVQHEWLPLLLLLLRQLSAAARPFFPILPVIRTKGRSLHTLDGGPVQLSLHVTG